jgi:hypothetical protein
LSARGTETENGLTPRVHSGAKQTKGRVALRDTRALDLALLIALLQLSLWLSAGMAG